MRINTLTLNNYRGIANLSLDLHPRLNVFIGVNGSGKSTILDSIALMLSWFVNRLINPKSLGKYIELLDINNNAFSATIKIVCSLEQEEIYWILHEARPGYTSKEIEVQELDKYLKKIHREIEVSQQVIDLPLCVYYTVNRAVLDTSLDIQNKDLFSPLFAYEEALNSRIDFKTFFEWFREREDLENENRKYINISTKPEDYMFPDPQLEIVRQVLASILPDFNDLSVRRNPLRMEVTKQGKKLTVNQLSDGEKCLIAMIGDLARRIAMLNPNSSNPLESEGIIIIDEIDLHLHPLWQRFIVPKMLEVFPNCQFFISTHSPHVITHIQPENLYILKQNEQGIIELSSSESSYGKTVECILEDLMGLDSTRPTEVDQALKKIFAHIAYNRIDAAKEAVENLKEKVPTDPEITRAEAWIRRKENNIQ